jgi:hypothetical protein
MRHWANLPQDLPSNGRWWGCRQGGMWSHLHSDLQTEALQTHRVCLVFILSLTMPGRLLTSLCLLFYFIFALYLASNKHTCLLQAQGKQSKALFPKEWPSELSPGECRQQHSPGWQGCWHCCSWEPPGHSPGHWKRRGCGSGAACWGMLVLSPPRRKQTQMEDWISK